MTIDEVMELVDTYAEHYMWQAGYEPPKTRAVALTERSRQAVIDALRHLTEVEA